MRLPSALGLVCLFVAKAVGQAPAKPSPEHKKLEVFVGTWTHTIELKESPSAAPIKITGTDRVELLGGFFVARHYTDKGPSGETRGIEILGYDPVKKTYTDNGFDSYGQASSGTWSVNGDTWNYMAATGRLRCTGTFGPGSVVFAVKCERSPDGAAWTPLYDGTWKKASDRT